MTRMKFRKYRDSDGNIKYDRIDVDNAPKGVSELDFDKVRSAVGVGYDIIDETKPASSGLKAPPARPKSPAQLEAERIAAEDAAYRAKIQQKLNPQAPESKVAPATLNAPVARKPVAPKPARPGEVMQRPMAPKPSKPKVLQGEPLRKAGSNLILMPREGSSAELDNLLTAWRELNQTDTTPDWYGLSELAWRERNEKAYIKLMELRNAGARADDLTEELLNFGFNDYDERRRIATAFYNDPEEYNLGRKNVLRNEYFGTPQAAADEDISMKALELAGFKPVRPGNEENAKGTDILAYANDKKYMIDAQQRLGRPDKKGLAPLNIGVARNINYERLLQDNPSMSLLSLIGKEAERRRNRGGRKILADKLMQSTDNYNPLEDLPAHLRKDLLISSHRPGVGHRTYNKGPYNRTRPEDIALYDLGLMRQDLLTKNNAELREMGVRPSPRGNKLSLVIPGEVLSKYINPDLEIAQSVLEQLTNPRR